MTQVKASMADTDNGAAKQPKGRQRVEIKKVEANNKRHVTFSKRKKGLFKKATELSVLSGAEIATIVVSGNGKWYGSPNCEAVVDRYLADQSDDVVDHPAATSWNDVEYLELPIERMGLEELLRYKTELQNFRVKAEARTNDMIRNIRCDFSLLMDDRLILGPIR